MSRSAGAGSAGGTIPVRLRQIALVTNDLSRAEDHLTYVLASEVIFRDPAVAQWGLANILIPLGGEIIEVVAPDRPDTTASRLLSKQGGPGGYMVIMQTLNAKARRDHIVARKLAKVVWEHETLDSHAVQYHPKDVKGGVIPELDSSTGAPDQLQQRFSRWHACGQDYESYSRGMRRHASLSILGCILRLAPGDMDAEGASMQWEEVFGVARNRDLLAFTNARLGFVPGKFGEREGLLSITVGVEGQQSLDGIMSRAKEKGLTREDGAVAMVGVRWYFSYMGNEVERARI